MSKEFVVGSVGVHDAAGLYKQAYDFYQYLLASEAEADRILEKAKVQVEKAKEQRPDLVPETEEVLDRALELDMRIREIRVHTLGVYVQTIGSILQIVWIGRERLKGEAIEAGLAQFDLDLERLQERYDKVYAPFYNIISSGEVRVPNVRKWGTFMWEVFDKKIAGPVLLWETISECKEKWAVADVPPCHGPDYLRAWILANQSAIMTESHAHALTGVAESLADFLKTSTIVIANGIEEVAKDIGLVVGAAVKGVAKGLGNLFWPLLLGGTALFVIMKSIKEKK